jgi:hypothetical protein
MMTLPEGNERTNGYVAPANAIDASTEPYGVTTIIVWNAADGA